MENEKTFTTDLVCFSHLSWKFVFQRPHHLLSRFTKKYAVFYVEEFIYTDKEDGYSVTVTNENVTVVLPHLSNQMQGKGSEARRKETVLVAPKQPQNRPPQLGNAEKGSQNAGISPGNVRY